MRNCKRHKAYLAILLLATVPSAHSQDLDDDEIFERWRREVLEEPIINEGRSISGNVETCEFPVRDAEGNVDHTALYKNCVCECLSESGNAKDIETCIETCGIPGHFEDGEYVPDDPAVGKLHEAGDIKTFYDYSLKGNGGAAGLAYELTDGMSRVPWGPRYRYQRPDDETGKCGESWEKVSTDLCRRGRRVNLTSEIAASEQALGFHLGLKFLPILDGGLFTGAKWNFDKDEFDVTLGFQWIKLSF